MSEQFTVNPHLIIPVGTQIVTRVEVKSWDGGPVYPRGAVGVVVYAPVDNSLPAHLTTLLQDIVRQGDSPSLRVVSVSDDGYHPSDDEHTVVKKMPDPQRPWHPLAWIRLVDSSHAGLDSKPLAEALCGPAAQGPAWGKQRRKHLKTTSDGITRVWQSASALRRKHGLWGTPKVYAWAY